MRVSLSLTALLAASLSQAQYLISELSFGHAGRISAPENKGQIPNFAVSGNPQTPEVLSNRIILTPLAPGNQRGAIWGTQTLVRPQWIADVDFRANGPERGGGNLNIWLVRGGPQEVGSSSIYTAGKFDGLALVVDRGMIRGYLNDGNTDYSKHHNVEELAFGHCAYAYRNQGRPSQIKMRHNTKSFRVEIDGQLCFETSKVKLPSGYQFGVTAATPDVPDSFELFKMVVMSDNTEYGSSTFETEKPKEAAKGNTQSRGYKRHMDYDQDWNEQEDEDADIFSSSKAQFQDLHNRLQTTNHQLSGVHRTVSRHQQTSEKQNNEMQKLLGEIRSEMRKLDEMNNLVKRVTSLEDELRSMRKDVTRKFLANERSVKGFLDDHHTNLSDTVQRAPGHGFLIFVVVGTQVVLIGAYIIYNRRFSSMSKKYL